MLGPSEKIDRVGVKRGPSSLEKKERADDNQKTEGRVEASIKTLTQKLRTRALILGSRRKIEILAEGRGASISLLKYRGQMARVTNFKSNGYTKKMSEDAPGHGAVKDRGGKGTGVNNITGGDKNRCKTHSKGCVRDIHDTAWLEESTPSEQGEGRGRASRERLSMGSSCRLRSEINSYMENQCDPKVVAEKKTLLFKNEPSRAKKANIKKSPLNRILQQ